MVFDERNETERGIEMSFSIGQRVTTTDPAHRRTYFVLSSSEGLDRYKISCGMQCWFPANMLVRASMKDISDGYHTFDDLYNHRMILTAAVCTLLKLENNWERTSETSLIGRCYRSWQHHPDDAPIFDGMFIVVIELPRVGQISYHYNAEHWDKFSMCETVQHAPKWDGHTAEDTITRIEDFIRMLND